MLPAGLQLLPPEPPLLPGPELPPRLSLRRLRSLYLYSGKSGQYSRWSHPSQPYTIWEQLRSRSLPGLRMPPPGPRNRRWPLPGHKRHLPHTWSLLCQTPPRLRSRRPLCPCPPHSCTRCKGNHYPLPVRDQSWLSHPHPRKHEPLRPRRSG